MDIKKALDNLYNIYYLSEECDRNSLLNKCSNLLMGITSFIDKHEADISDLVTVGQYAADILNDIPKAKRYFSRAAACTAKYYISVYANSPACYPRNMMPIEKALSTAYFIRYCSTTDQENIVIDNEHLITRELRDALIMFFNLVLEYDCDSLNQQFSTIDENTLAAGWLSFDVMGDIATWMLSLFRDDGKYVECVEALLNARVTFLNKPTSHLAEYIWDGDTELYLYLGEWYSRRSLRYDLEKAFNYLVSSSRFLPPFAGESHIKCIRLLYQVSIKLNIDDNTVWQNLHSWMQSINAYKNEMVFSLKDISECQNRVI